jgi:putative endonuclease
VVWDHEVAGSNPVAPIDPSLMFYCYVLRSQKTGRRYVGSCEDREERLRRHNAGDTKATKHGIPWSLIHSEAFFTRGEATAREHYYKTGRGRDELDSFL